MIKKVEKYLRKGSFLAQFQTLLYFKLETLFCRYFEKILTRSTEKLFRRTLLDD